jgi:hypothetical protein
VLKALRFSDGMKGGTPGILYDLYLGLDTLYSKPIDGLPTSCSWYGGVFHVPVNSASFIMDKAFWHMQHDDVVRKDLFQVMEVFP